MKQKEGQEHLSGAEGIAMLDNALASTPGVSFADFMRSPKGQEFLTTKKIVIAGAPQSGKSVLRELLKRSVRAIPGAPYPYFVTAAPDGEWAGFQESVKQDPESARRMKMDYKDAIKKSGSMFTPEYVKRISDSVKNLSAPHSPLNFLDIGGKMSAENLGICENANAAIILCGEKATKVGMGRGSPEDIEKPEMDPREWKEFFTSMGIPVIAAIYSDYTGKEDSVLGIDETGAFAGSSHYFERGEMDVEHRPAIRTLAEYLVSGGVESQMYRHAALANLNETSRTAKGEVNVEASTGKIDSMSGITEQETADRAIENFMHVIERLYAERERNFANANELRTFVETVAQQVNDGIIKEGMLIRKGTDSATYPYTRVAELPAAMEQFYGEFLDRLSRSDDPKEVAAWIEYRIDLTDHFFADGCGKTAKAISSWVLMKAKQQLPKYRGREEYYAYAPKKIRNQNLAEDAQSFAKWLNYYKSLF